MQLITSYLINNKIKCFKYNFSLENKTQKFNNQQAHIQLSHNSEELIITNRKFNTKPVYLLEADHNIVKAKSHEYRNKKRHYNDQVDE